MSWNTNPTPDQVQSLIMSGVPTAVVEQGDWGFEIEYADGRRLKVEPQDGRVYSEWTADGATIAYAIFTPKQGAA